MLHDWTVSNFDDKKFLTVMGSPNEDGSIWHILSQRISTGAYKNPLQTYPLICEVAFSSKSQFQKGGPFWGEGVQSFAIGILLLAQRYPYFVLAQKDTTRRVSKVGAYSPAADKILDEDWQSALQHCMGFPQQMQSLHAAKGSDGQQAEEVSQAVSANDFEGVYEPKTKADVDRPRDERHILKCLGSMPHRARLVQLAMQASVQNIEALDREVDTNESLHP
jgi:hypothetical protein